MTKKKRVNKLGRHLRKTYGFEFVEAHHMAKAMINGRFFAYFHKWFRHEPEWGVQCARGCCRGATGRGLYITRRADGSEIVLNSDDIKYFEKFGG